jgi:meso-butanediol dehydrogenase / (S,S)-butanediol dehydrogenase / diacetyl reductase
MAEGQRALENKAALITGGGSGIGAAITKRFVAKGAKVCITGRRKEVLAKQIEAMPAGTATFCVGDVTNLEDVRRMVGMGTWGRSSVPN